MIAYFDTSALIPVIIEEPASALASRLWDDAEHVVSVRLIYAEARAALAQAGRLERLDTAGLRRAIRDLEDLYAQMDRVEVDEHLVRRAGTLAQEHALRGYDAVHLAAAERAGGPETVVVAADQAMCSAARALAMAVAELP